MKALRSAGIACLIALAFVSSANAGLSHSYKPTIVAGAGSTGYAVNDSGQATGFIRVGDKEHAFIYNGGFQDIAGIVDPTANKTAGIAITNSGKVIVNRRNGLYEVFRYDIATGTVENGGAALYLGTASGVNNAGLVVGGSDPAAPPVIAVSYGGALEPLMNGGNPVADPAQAVNNAGLIIGNTAGSPYAYAGGAFISFGINAYAYALNDAGVIVGYAPDASRGGGWYPALLGPAAVAFIPGFDATIAGGRAEGINSQGDIVGQMWDAGGANKRAFLFHDGQVIDLNTVLTGPIPYTITNAVGITDNGWIIGNAQDANGIDFAIRLQSAPLPDAAMMGFGLLAAVGAYGLYRRLRRAE